MNDCAAQIATADVLNTIGWVIACLISGFLGYIAGFVRGRN